MNINDFGSGLPERIPSGTEKIGPPHAQFAKSVATEKLKSLGESDLLHARDPEIVQFVRQLNELPDTRPDKLVEIQARIESGEYLTRHAAEETARAMLR